MNYREAGSADEGWHGLVSVGCFFGRLSLLTMLHNLFAPLPAWHQPVHLFVCLPPGSRLASPYCLHLSRVFSAAEIHMSTRPAAQDRLLRLLLCTPQPQYSPASIQMGSQLWQAGGEYYYSHTNMHGDRQNGTLRVAKLNRNFMSEYQTHANKK